MHNSLPPPGWRLLLLTLLVLGIFFRVVNLDHKVYWHDEVYTSIRIAGYTGDEVSREIFKDQVIGVQELQKYQRISPDKGLDDTLKALAKHPEHPPLYYLMARFWVQLFGSSVTAIRSLSAVISLLAFPSIYWLCRELFTSIPSHIHRNTPLQKLHSQTTDCSPPASSAPPVSSAPSAPSALLIGWVAIALLSISPFHVVYAQEARQYSLWTVTILLTNAALIRAIRLNNNRSWVIYATTLILGLYTSLFSILGAIGQGIYVITLEKFRWTKTIKSYLIASLVAIIVFAPWLVLTITTWQSLQGNTTWTKVPISLLILIGCWFLNLSSIFIDLFFGSTHPLTYIVPPILSVLVGYAIYFLFRHTPQQVWLLILTMILANILPLIVPDLIFGGQRSASTRYFIPGLLGIQLAVAYLFAEVGGRRKENKGRRQKAGGSPDEKNLPLGDESSFFSVACSPPRRGWGSVLLPSAFLRSYQRQIWQGIMAVVISSGVLCCIISFPADSWWNKLFSYQNPLSAKIINQAYQPLVISNTADINTGELISLSYLLDEKVKFQLISQPQIDIPPIPEGFSDLFLFYPSEILRKGLEQKYRAKIEPMTDLPLWKLTMP
ncbi:MAG: hypothetical protein F6J96_14140 [Symploca sp. SIO1C2]|nr:hypothetical protein [Symploca sp. SIO1C2]